MKAMTRFSLLLRNLRYFRASNLAVGAGMAVATAVLTGALMVGDSVRGSLRELAVRRLGKVDHALVGVRFFNVDLADRLASDGYAVAPAILTRGGAANETGEATAGVQIAAIGGNWLPVPRRQVVLNDELKEVVGDEVVLLRLPTAEDVPRDAALARRGRDEALSGMRVIITPPPAGADKDFINLFNLEGSQRVPRNAWVNLVDLQSAVDQPGRVNALVVTDTAGKGVKALNARLKEVVMLDDYGLSFTTSPDGSEATLNSRATFIERPVLEAAERVAGEMGIELRRVSVYLINTVGFAGAPDNAAEGKKIYYAVGAGIDKLGDSALAPDEVALNEWAAEQIGAKVGDRLRFTYYLRQSGGQLAEVASDRPGVGLTLRVARILPMSGLGADPTLTPEYKGLTDAESFSDWNPPVGMEIDEKLADEEYWDRYRAAPKVFVNLDTARTLWGGVYGDLTGLRIPAASVNEFSRRLRDEIDPSAMGMAFRPIRQEQLAASAGSTDFSILFVAFSFFLIVAAALLVAMLFRLNLEQRARQIGLIGALGFAPKAIRRMALGEGMLVALLGGLVGLAGAIGYTWLIMAGLRTWWVGAVGTTAMRLHVSPLTLLIGLAASLLVAMAAIAWAAWDIGRADAARLLAGGWHSRQATSKRRGRIARWLAIGTGVIGLALLGLGAARVIKPEHAFLGGGSALLVACLSGLAAFLRPRPRMDRPPTGISVLILGIRNAARHTGRSVLSIGLIAFAAFTLVTVASMKEGPPDNTHERESGAGGYRLMVQADIPLLADLGTEAGRDQLGLDNPDDPLWDRVSSMSIRNWAGQDISCLNLTKPNSPSILAVPPAMVERNAFTFSGATRETDNAWALLEEDLGEEIPVITDAETAQYILKLGLGKTLTITDQLGNKRKLKLVATLSHSIFQSHLLMSEDNFLDLFPSQSGYGVVLVETTAADEATVQRELATALEENAATVDRTADRLAAYAEVKNTYLSTFQTLGSLGLMLGTIGLAVVLLRGLVERRAELALLAAIGFKPLDRLRLVLAENAYLLTIGLLVGAGCAVLGVSPAIFSSERTVNIAALALTLLAVLAVGLAGLVIAVWLGQRSIRPADLRLE